MKKLSWRVALFALGTLFALSISVAESSAEQKSAEEKAADAKEKAPLEPRKENVSPLSQQVEDLKQSALELNRDLLILEEDLLFPANTQIAVYVSVDVGHFFQLDAVKLTIDDQLVATHIYEQKENSALSRGGIQRLYLGNVKTGKREISAYFHGYGPQQREYKRAATYTLKKDQTPTMLEIRVIDSSASLEPDFDFKEWHLQ